MLLDAVRIYKARRDPALAAKLAAELARDQALDRALAPLQVAKLLLAAGLAACALLIAGALWLAVAAHGSLALLAVIPALAGLVLFALLRGLQRGQRLVERQAAALVGRGMDLVMKADSAPSP